MKNGFTLLELLEVVLIIGVLAGVALPQYTKAVDRSRWTPMLQMERNVSRAHLWRTANMRSILQSSDWIIR